jgi:ArsR family transcriptional regulator, arsenate/arsenite/antimonite-responsive transcriptional repressor
MDDLLAFGKTLSDPTRIRILNALLQSELCVCELVDALQISQSSISSQLQFLRAIGMVQTEKRRTWIIYSVTNEIVDLLHHVFQNFPTDDRRIAEDNIRIKRRLRLRIDGCCVQGAGALKGEAVARAS